MQVKPFQSATDESKLIEALLEKDCYETKVSLLEKQVLLTPEMRSCISRFQTEQRYVILATIVIGQGHIFDDWQMRKVAELKTLASILYTQIRGDKCGVLRLCEICQCNSSATLATGKACATKSAKACYRSIME